MANIDFHQLDEPAPEYDLIAAEYQQISAQLDSSDIDQLVAAVQTWDQLRRRLDTWEALTQLRFNQDTTNADYKAARDYCDGLRPKLTELAIAVKRKLLASPERAELAKRLGAQAFALWEVDVLTFDPVIEADLVEESKLEAEYIELHASAQLDFRGESFNLSSIIKFREAPDRQTRLAAEKVRWGWFDKNREQLDRIYDDQVRLRTAMARKLGYQTYTELGYKRMCRIGYDRADVETFRNEVREHVVPIGLQLRKRQAERIGVEALKFWDESLDDPRGNPRPAGDHDWMLLRAQEMFDALGGGLDDFFRLLETSHLMDLKNRQGKAGGGFCTSFPTHGVPYIFANFNGTRGDVEVFTHEVGHAFQCYMSREQPLTEYLWPTIEACEIHSMGLEFLTWPQMERFFGEDAERFRMTHLEHSLLFLPYGVAVDHFQHLVYDQPDATPAERHAMWQEMERTYLPWRDYGDLPHVDIGGFWQTQRHIYLHPFYYIDYTLAQTCALQFWLRAQQDFDGAMKDYVALCRRGGEAPFVELAQSAGLTSPFESGCLKQVVASAAKALDV